VVPSWNTPEIFFIEKQYAKEGCGEGEDYLVSRWSDPFGTAIPFGSTMNQKNLEVRSFD
jgi:hypothetical protein